MPLSQVVKKRTEGGILRHGGSARHTGNKIILYIEPFIYLFKVVRLIVFHPVIFPDGVFDRNGSRAGYHKRFEKDGNACSGYLYAVGNALFKLLPCALIHIAERSADGFQLLIHKHKPLHLRAERNTLYRVGIDTRFFDRLVRGLAHGFPPLLGILLRAAVRKHIERIACRSAAEQLDGFGYRKDTGLYAGGSYIKCNSVSHMKRTFLTGCRRGQPHKMCLQLPSALYRARKRDGIGILQIASYRKSVCKARHLYTERLQQL